ncbi:MAG: hypothetical protein ACRD0F_04530 [Acidimicrobiales bacterium]
MRLRHLLAALIVPLLLLAAPAAPALAVKGAGGGGNGPSTGAAIVFDRNPVAVGSEYRVSGSGFRANAWVTVGAHFADATWWTSMVTDAAGTFAYSFTATSAGDVLHEAKEQGRNGSLRLKATATLTVVPA